MTMKYQTETWEKLIITKESKRYRLSPLRKAQLGIIRVYRSPRKYSVQGDHEVTLENGCIKLQTSGCLLSTPKRCNMLSSGTYKIVSERGNLQYRILEIF